VLHRPLGLALAFTACVTLSPRAASSASSLFDEYRGRDYQQFEADLSRLQGQEFAGLLSQAKGTESKWPPDVGAAYLLEVTAACVRAELFPHIPGQPFGSHRTRAYSGGAIGADPRRDFAPLFDLASSMAKRTPPDSTFSGAWAQAAVALLEGADEVSPQVEASVMGSVLSGLLDSMRDRLNQQTILMAKGHIQESIAAEVASYDFPTVQGNRLWLGDGMAVSSVYSPIKSALDTALTRGLTAFAAAEAFPDVRAEAAVRWGGLALLRNGPDDAKEALARFRLARESIADADVIYLSWFFEGRALLALGQRDEALHAFQEAARLKPQAGSAQLEWAAQAFLAGDTATADRLTQALLNLPINPDDPWILFPRGDYRHWSQRVENLRAALR
jgi:hypothetical protein